MGDLLLRYTAEEIQAALGDDPFVVRGLWPEEPGAVPPPPAAPARPASDLPTAEPPLPVGTASWNRSAPPAAAFDDLETELRALEADLRRPGPRRHSSPRRWPLVLSLSGTALAAACVGVWLMPPSGGPAPSGRAATRPDPVPLALADGAPASLLAPAPPAHSPAVARAASRDPAEAPPPAGTAEPAPDPSAPAPPGPPRPAPEPPASAPPHALEAPPAAPDPATAAAAAPVVPDAPRPSDPVLAAALMRRAEAALARDDIAAARAFFVRAASVDAWSVEAMIGAGKTYDPGFLRERGIAGGLADPAEARRWYGRASLLGDPTAAALTERLGQGGGG